MFDKKFISGARKCSDVCYRISSAKDIEEYLESEDIDICEIFSEAGYYLEKFLKEYENGR